MKTLLLIATILSTFASFAQPNYEKVHSRFVKMERLGLTGAGVKIAILDCGGIRTGNPGDATWVNWDYGYDFINDDSTVTTTCEHGNFVLTAIKSSEGLAPGAEVHMLKIADDAGNADTAALLLALQYCIDSSIDIVNISGSVSFSTFESKINEVLDAGAVVVGASGNSTGETTTSFPAAYDGVIAVNAIDSLGGIYVANVQAPGSPAGAHGINIAASGRHCYVIGLSNVLVTSSGTSFSAPWVVGCFALYKERYPTMSNHAVMQLIIDRAIKQPNTTYFGAGRPTF